LRYSNNAGFERSGGSGKFGKKGGSGMKVGFGMRKPNGSFGEVPKSSDLGRADHGRGGNFDRRPSGSGDRFERTGSGRDDYQRAQTGGFERGRFDSREGGVRNWGGDGRMDYKGVSGNGGPSRTREEGSRRFDNGRLGREPNKLDRSSGKHWTAGRPDHRSMHGGDTSRITQSEPNESWAPIKKLTFQAMAGLRALHTNDPETFNREALSQRYGISYDAVTRILRSDFQDRRAQEAGEKIQGTKWDMNPGTSRLSPVRAINRAFGKGESS
jgi:hypothetical protein